MTEPTATAPEKKDRLQRWIESHTEDAQASLAKFQASLAKDPAYALEWGGDALTASAWLKVLAILAALKAEGRTAAQMADHARTAVLQAAKYPSRSTSPMYNLRHQEIASAWANALERLETEAEREREAAEQQAAEAGR